MNDTNFASKQSTAEESIRALPLRVFLVRLIWLCVLPLMFLAAYLAYHHIYTLQAQRDREATDQVHNVATALDRNLWARISALQMLAASPLVDDPPRLQEFYKEAQGFCENFGGQVILADLSMQMIFNTRVSFGAVLPKLPQPKSHAAVPTVLKTGKPAVGDMFIGPIAKEPLVAVVVPVIHNGQVKALLLNIVETRLFQQRLENVVIPAGWSLTLFDGSDKEMARRTPMDGVSSHSFSDSTGRFVARLSVSHWSVVLEIPRNIYRAPILATASALALAIFAVTLLSVLGGRLASRRLARSMASLTQTPLSEVSHPIIAEVEAVRTMLAEAATTRAASEKALHESESRFRTTFELAAVGIAHVAPDGHWLRVNQRLCDIVGYTHEELLAKTFQDITHPDDLETDLGYVRQMLANAIRAYSMEKRYLRKDGSVVWINLTVSLVRDEAGEPNYFISVVEDMTERKQAEKEREELQAQLIQAQKMESVGRLAGGVAHDFNNMLQAILGYCDLSLCELDAKSPLHVNLREIHNAAQRSADLTRQLLAFARKQVVSPRALNLNEALSGLQKMLQRLIGEDIDLVWLPKNDLWTVHIDPSQVDQILANLAVNARDAIAGVGKITIETDNLVLDAAYCAKNPGATPGEYVVLTVSDNGGGMSKETIAQIFEPFYTTKEIGKGTGLGLATVYGIVKQNKGFINVYSELGQGSAFRIYLPRCSSGEQTIQSLAVAEKSRGGTETVLLVEDEPSILRLGQTILEQLGYTVLPATTPDEAISQMKQHANDIRLLVTDVILPEMNGKDLMERLATIQPRLKCLYISGYTADVIARHGVLQEGVHFIQKPFYMNDFARKVREVLESPS